MKFTDNLIEKYGWDKLLHFSVGGWITALGGMMGLYPLIGAILLVFVLSMLKEYRLDDMVDRKDMFAALIGSGISVLFFIISALL